MKPEGLSIGRARDNDIVLSSPTVAEYHARVQRVGGEYRVVAINREQPTYLITPAEE